MTIDMDKNCTWEDGKVMTLQPVVSSVHNLKIFWVLRRKLKALPIK